MPRISCGDPSVVDISQITPGSYWTANLNDITAAQSHVLPFPLVETMEIWYNITCIRITDNVPLLEHILKYV